MRLPATLRRVLRRRLALVSWCAITAPISLSTVEAVAVVADDPAFILSGRDHWTGLPDLSFHSVVSEKDGVLGVIVDVFDDKVIWDGAASDRVEIRFADGALVAASESARTGFEAQKAEVRAALASEERAAETVDEVEKGIAAAERAWREAEQQLVTTFVLAREGPRGWSPKPRPESHYEKTPSGYRAWATIPLQGALSPTTGSVRELRYVIDIVDVDIDENGARAETRMTSVRRPSGEDIPPAAFDRLELSQEWKLARDEGQRVAAELETGGRYALRDGQYVYELASPTGTDFKFDGMGTTPNVSAPPAWEIFSPTDVSRRSDLRLFVGRDHVLLEAPGPQGRVDLVDGKLLFQARRSDGVYLVFEESVPSRPELPSATCGAGVEGSLVWIALSPQLDERQRKSLLVDSCWHNLQEPYTVSDKGLKGETELIDETTGEHRQRVTFEYDNDHPERGFVVRERSESDTGQPSLTPDVPAAE